LDSPIAVGSYDVTITFDPSIVRVVSSNVTGGTGDGFTGKPISINIGIPGQVRINNLQTDSMPIGTFSVANIVFVPVGGGTSTLGISVNAITDTGNGFDIPGASASLSVSSVTVVAGP